MAQRSRKKTSRAKTSAPRPKDGAVEIPGELAREMRPDLWDPTDPGFRLWTPRDTTGDPRREAGPFWPHRQAARARMARHPDVLPPAGRPQSGGPQGRPGRRRHLRRAARPGHRDARRRLRAPGDPRLGALSPLGRVVERGAAPAPARARRPLPRADGGGLRGRGDRPVQHRAHDRPRPGVRPGDRRDRRHPAHGRRRSLAPLAGGGGRGRRLRAGLGGRDPLRRARGRGAQHAGPPGEPRHAHPAPDRRRRLPGPQLHPGRASAATIPTTRPSSGCARWGCAPTTWPRSSGRDGTPCCAAPSRRRSTGPGTSTSRSTWT